KGGALSPQRLKDEVAAAKERAVQPDGMVKAERLDLEKLLVRSEQEPPPAGPGVPPGTAPPPAQGDLLQMADQQRRLAEQQVTESVDKTIRNAKQLLNTDPDGAYNLLKRQHESVVNAGGIGEPVKVRLST